MAAPTVVLPHTASRADWLAARRHGITATKIAAVAGVHPWLSAIEVYDDMVGIAADVEENTAMRAGTWLEPFICREWAADTGRAIARAGLFAHPVLPWMMATPDRLVLKPGRTSWFGKWANVDSLLEAKTALGWGALAWSDEVPTHVQMQVQWQLAVTGLDRAWVVALAGPQIKPFAVERDDELIADLTDIGEAFLADVKRKVPPTPDGTERTARYLARRSPATPGATTVLDPDVWADLYETYWGAHRQAAEHEQDKTAAANAMRLLLGSAEEGYLPGETKPAVTFRESHPVRFDAKAFAADEPDLYAAYRRPAAEPQRTLSPRKPPRTASPKEQAA